MAQPWTRSVIADLRQQLRHANAQNMLLVKSAAPPSTHFRASASQLSRHSEHFIGDDEEEEEGEDDDSSYDRD